MASPEPSLMYQCTVCFFCYPLQMTRGTLAKTVQRRSSYRKHSARKPLWKTTIPVEWQVLALVWFMANSEVMRSVSDRFNVTLSSLFRIIQRVKSWCSCDYINVFFLIKPNNISTSSSTNSAAILVFRRVTGTAPGFTTKWKNFLPIGKSTRFHFWPISNNVDKSARKLDSCQSRILVISRPSKRAHLLRSNLYCSSWLINLLLDGLVCSIVGYFYSSLVFWLALRARQNTAWPVKMSHDSTH